MELTLVYPHQLFRNHPAVAAGRDVLLVEHPLFFGNDARWPLAVHRQRLVLHRASMMAYADELRAAGLRVSHQQNPGGKVAPEPELPHKVKRVHVADLVDDVLGRRLRKQCTMSGAELVVHPSPNFLSPPDFLSARLAGGRKPLMATFYQAQRKRMGILLEADGSPTGGQWSFDTENRARLPKNHPVPPEPRTRPDPYVEAATAEVRAAFPDHPGDLDDFRWPVTRADSESWLDGFLEWRFAGFGTYEDAISTAHPFIHHAAITPMLNIGLLDPQGVVDRALEAARKFRVPLNSLEGFIRQVIGWREFIRGIYVHRGNRIRSTNFWGFERPMPAAFYDGTTGIPPVDRLIRQLLKEGYCHHIERLMVLGNFMLLCRIHPDEVCKWFMELFVDAYDWVMVPNVHGMSQFADGGTFTTKPYISGSNYILKMSDEPKGTWCGIWDGLFWSFIADYQEFFLANPRLAMMARTWAKLSPEKQQAHRDSAAKYLASLA
jgi:deoxyribodipyrimidine photolyase-related protein